MVNPTEKDRILGRVREALREKTDAHVRQVARASLPVLPAGGQAPVSTQEFLPPVGESPAERIALFGELSARLQTEFEVVHSVPQAVDVVRRLAAENGWRRVGVHSHELVGQVVSQLDIEKFPTDQDYDAIQLEQCDAGITGCDALIAQTASVLVTSASAGGRALSVLPPHHVVLAHQEQLVGSMVDGYRLLQNRYPATHWPSFISFITGPSRTADVERVLVLGAHGPKRLTVVLID